MLDTSFLVQHRYSTLRVDVDKSKSAPIEDILQLFKTISILIVIETQKLILSGTEKCSGQHESVEPNSTVILLFKVAFYSLQ
jgi:hypothetical protein